MKLKITRILCISILAITAAGCANNTIGISQTEPASEISFDADTDDILEEYPDLSKSKFRETAISHYNLSEAEADAMYQKIEDSKILQKENIKITGAALNDYDGNGQTDMLVCLYEEKENGDNYADGCLYLFMNDDTPYYIYDDFCCYSFGDIFGDFGADIDHDGYTEIVFCVQGTGCGGAGDCQKFVLKYKDSKIIRMELPDDFPSEYDYDSGLCVDVKRDSENQVYHISCPYLGETIDVGIADDDEEDFGEGANCRGYFTLEMTEHEGGQFLAGYEYLYVGSIASGVGNAVFLFDWDENGKVSVKDWYVEDWDGNRYVPADRTQKPASDTPEQVFDQSETGAEVKVYEEFLTGKRKAVVSDKLYANGSNSAIMDTTLDKTQNGFFINDLITVITNEVGHTLVEAESLIKRMEYALIDCGGDGKKQLVLRAIGMGFYTVGDDSDLTMVFDCNGEELSMIYSVESWARSNTTFFKNGYVFGAGSGGAATHYVWEGIIKADGTYHESYDCHTETGQGIYGMSSPWEIWDTMERDDFPAEFNEYKINGETVYSYYILDDVTDEEKKIVMDYIKDNEARLGIRFLTYDEAWARVDKYRKSLGITDDMADEENRITWRTFSL